LPFSLYAIDFACQRLSVFFLPGILAGPYGLGLINGVQDVETLAEIGVVLLLFYYWNRVLVSTTAANQEIFPAGRVDSGIADGTGYLCYSEATGPVCWRLDLYRLSYSAFQHGHRSQTDTGRAEVDSPHGRVTLGILIFQDIIIVPMILITPLLAGANGNPVESVIVLTAKGIGIIALVIVSARWIVPKVLYQIARTRNRELFLLSIVVICLAVAWITSSAGLSLALGAFLAGLIISESEYSHQALGNILPFRDVFTSFFFVSIGMLLDVGFLFRNPGTVVLIASGVLVLKSIVGGFATILLGFPLRTSILVGLALGQVGEFSFILSRSGIEYGLVTEDIYQMFLSFSILTMAATPLIMTIAPRLADVVVRLPLPGRLIAGFYPVSEIKVKAKKDHLVIIGFGVNGRNVARAAGVAGIPYAIIEMNPER